MKRILSLAFAITVLAIPQSASAQSVNYQTEIQKLLKINLDSKPTTVIQLSPTAPDTTPIAISTPETKPVEPVTPKPLVHIVASGDNLSSIAATYNVTWLRLWAKNTQLTSPDVIQVGDSITIPDSTEELSRDLPVIVAPIVQTPAVVSQTVQKAIVSAPISYAYDASNTYAYGYCTWYVKNRRGASLPNTLGNANTWYSRAWSMGMAVGTTPRAGAVGTTTAGSLGHVVYVESVNSNGTITISEMNAAAGWNAVNTRTANASEFVYIY
jgi:surface antigen